MFTSVRVFISAAAAVAAAVGPSAAAWSGEIAGKTAKCALSGASPGSCSWTSTKCTRPEAPMLYAGTSAELNKAGEALNKYVGELNVYMKCVSGEAQADVNAAVETIKAGADKVQSETMADFNRLKSQLDSDRLRLQTR